MNSMREDLAQQQKMQDGECKAYSQPKDVGSICNTWIHTATVYSRLPRTLIDAYLQTDYRVTAGQSFSVNVGVSSAELSSLFQRLGCNGVCVITAWNPYGKALRRSENIRLATQLIHDMQSRCKRFLRGIGQHPSGDWPGEESLLVLDIELADSIELGNRFHQNAVVWAGKDAVPRLIILQ